MNLFLLSAFRRMREGNVFTGVCPFTGVWRRRGGEYPKPGQVTPPSPMVRIEVPPASTGYPSPSCQNQDGCAVRVVCLLCSRRRTFLSNRRKAFTLTIHVNMAWPKVWTCLKDCLEGHISSFFFQIFCLDQGPFCGATDCSCFGLRVSFLMGFKSRVDILPALFLACILWSWRSRLVWHLPFPPIGVYTV